MEILGVGPTEFLFIIVIALIVLGPRDLAKTGKTVGKWLNQLIHSDGWKIMQKTSKELRQLPTQLMREDNLQSFLESDDPRKQAEDKKQNASYRPQVTTTAASPSSKDLSTPPTEASPIHGSVPAAFNTIQPPVSLVTPPAPVVKSAPKKPAATPRKKATPAKTKTGKPEKKPVSRKKSNA